MTITIEDYKRLEGLASNAVNQIESLKLELQREKKEKEEILKGQFLGGKSPDIFTGMNRAGSDEMQCLAQFGVSSVKQLLNINTGSPFYDHVNPRFKSLVKNLKREFQTARFISQYFYGDPLDRLDPPNRRGREKDDEGISATVKSIAEHYYGKNVINTRLKAFGTEAQSAGAEWIWTETVSNYVDEYELPQSMWKNINQVTMRSKVQEIPTKGHSVARRGMENSPNTARQFRTGEMELRAKKFVEYIEISEEMDEDSAPDFVSAAQSELVSAHNRAHESALINGVEIGDGTTHIDGDIPASDDLRAEWQWDGWRKRAIDAKRVVDFDGTVDVDKLTAMRLAMGNLGLTPSQLIWLVSMPSYFAMYRTKEVQTVDKYGQSATILTGELGKYQGSSVVPSDFMRIDLGADGVRGGSAGNFTGILLIRRDRWWAGTRRPIRLALRPSPSNIDQLQMASYSRSDFTGMPQDREASVVYGRNIPSTVAGVTTPPSPVPPPSGGGGEEESGEQINRSRRGKR